MIILLFVHSIGIVIYDSQCIQYLLLAAPYRLDSAADLMSLHVGDRVLEVNGRPVEDHCIEDIENLIVCSRDAIQVS